MKTALISVFDKNGLHALASQLFKQGYRIISTGGTYRLLSENFIDEVANSKLYQVSEYTGFPEILDGRVKTLHPIIYAGLLAKRDNPDHLAQIQEHDAWQIDMVVANLYPFHRAVVEDMKIEDAQELIDIGGVTLIRAAAKNFQNVIVLTDPADYSIIMNDSEVDQTTRKNLATKAFQHTCSYDAQIANYLMSDTSIVLRTYQKQRTLKYGCNPHQTPAGLYTIDQNDHDPFKVLSGTPGYINYLDAFNAWQLVKEISDTLKTCCAASFKHTSPAGVGIAVDLDPTLQEVYMLGKSEVSPLATAFLRARNSDPMSSFGDFIALSSQCDLQTAMLIKREVSDGVVAPGYTQEALEVLCAKKNGNYIILEVDPTYQNTEDIEFRELFGVAMAQPPNTKVVGSEIFDDHENIVSINKQLNSDTKRDLLLANITLKYAQSNNVAMAVDGQVVAIASGQQSRVDCVKLCSRKLRTWYLRQHPKAHLLLNLFRQDVGIKRQDKVNAVVRYVEGDFTLAEYDEWVKMFVQEPEPLTEEEKIAWIATLKERYPNGVCLASDAFFPFRDNIDHASRVGVKHVIQPGGSSADDCVIQACNKYGMSLVHTGVRQFTH